MNVIGSPGETSNSCVESTRVSAADAITPTTMPVQTGRAVSFRIMTTTSRRVAPRAIRTPISCVRLDTKYAITP